MCDGMEERVNEMVKTWHTRIGKTTAINRSFALPLHSTTTKQMQSIGWEPVASTNRIDNCLVGFEPEYNYQGDGWED